MEVFLLIIRLALVAVFGLSGIAKLFDPDGSAKAFEDFGVPKPLVRPMTILLPAAELLIAGALLFVHSSWFGAIGASALMVVFTAAMLYQLAMGNAPDCHCFGQISSEPVGASSVARNVALMALSGFLVLQGRQAQGLELVSSNQEIMQFVIGIAIVGLLVAVIFYLRTIAEQQIQIMRRIELMDLVAREKGTVEREDAGHPHEGLPIGAQFPDFELPDATGGAVTLDDLKAGGEPVLLFFVSPTCSPCKALVPEFEQWQIDLKDKLKLVFVSSGTPEDNLEKFGGESSNMILLQKEREYAELLKAQWTPTAVLMDASGRVASHVAAGDTAIRSLVERLKAEDLKEEYTHFANVNGHSHSNKIGLSVPDFSLIDTRGNQINSDYFRGKETLVAFWSLTCPYCLDMMEGLREWNTTKGGDGPELVVFSDSKHDVDAFGPDSTIIFDIGHKTSVELGMYGTPSAILVDEHGRIISETAIGAPDIWSLIGKSK